MDAPTDPSQQAKTLATNIFRAQIDTLYRTFMPGALGALGAAYILLATFVAVGDTSVLTGVIWAAMLSAGVAFQEAIHRLYLRSPFRYNTKFWANLFLVPVLYDGLWWGFAALLLPQNVHNNDQQFLVIAVALVIATGAVPAHATYLPALLVFLLPISILTALSQILQGGVLHNAICLLIGVYFVTVFTLGVRSNNSLAELFRLRFEHERLVAEVSAQRDKAEEANAAKSRFLASASHDLRQPVHALGMFAGALGRHPLPAEMAALVDQIEASVQSMELLFGSMLDISRLDAGIVEANPQDLAIGPLLERIVLELADEAASKELALRFVPTSVTIRSDAGLLERVIRNLISNAVRYTDGGSILVGCRRGKVPRIEIWDTGRGIAPENQDRIFNEYFQVGNPQRAREQGLGLGLSIVKRLIALLGHRLELTSVLGHGSVFRVYVPPALDAPKPLAEQIQVPVVESSLAGALIAVVDDDPGVRIGMTALLTAWGARVIATATGDELLQLLDGDELRPRIIISDFRLPNDEDGIEVIHRTRRHLGADIPAVLVTGDTASERVRRAHSSGFHVLFKPIPNGRLRALVGNLLRTSA